jgi:hypothetical protein
LMVSVRSGFAGAGATFFEADGVAAAELEGGSEVDGTGVAVVEPAAVTGLLGAPLPLVEVEQAASRRTAAMPLMIMRAAVMGAHSRYTCRSRSIWSRTCLLP